MNINNYHCTPGDNNVLCAHYNGGLLQNLLADVNRIRNDGKIVVKRSEVHDWNRNGDVVKFVLNDSDVRYRVKNLDDGQVIRKLLII